MTTNEMLTLVKDKYVKIEYITTRNNNDVAFGMETVLTVSDPITIDELLEFGDCVYVGKFKIRSENEYTYPIIITFDKLGDIIPGLGYIEKNIEFREPLKKDLAGTRYTRPYSLDDSYNVKSKLDILKNAYLPLTELLYALTINDSLKIDGTVVE